MMSSNNRNLIQTFEKLIPDKVLFAIKDFDNALSEEALSEFQIKHPLSGCEFLAIQKAVPKREIEYRIGRSLAREILGLDPLDTKTSLYKKSNGSPNWPQNIVGSISHTGSTCIVAVADKKHFSGIGIDIEDGIFEAGLQRLIVNEQHSCIYPGRLSPLASLRAAFCCKEAVFKSLELVLIEHIDFLDVNIRYLKPHEGDIYDFAVKFTRDVPCLRTFNTELFLGRVYANEHYAASVAVIRPEEQ